MKECNTCHTVKPLDAFYLRRTGKYAGQPKGGKCKACLRAHQRPYEVARRATQPDVYAQTRQRYHGRHGAAAQRAYDFNRRATKLGVALLGPLDVQALIERDAYTCYLCHTVLDPATPRNRPGYLTLNYVIPLERGGTHTPDNLRVCCRSCVSKKRNYLLSELAAARESQSLIADRIRHSPEYTAWRTAVFTRDAWTCQACGTRGGRLQADHILPFALFPELRFTVSNGRTLCLPCHRQTPTYLGRAFRVMRRVRRYWRRLTPAQRAALHHEAGSL